eukprot:scaffold249472_cov22-Tisochrysis_lutea.AAC.2
MHYPPHHNRSLACWTHHVLESITQNVPSTGLPQPQQCRQRKGDMMACEMMVGRVAAKHIPLSLQHPRTLRAGDVRRTGAVGCRQPLWWGGHERKEIQGHFHTPVPHIHTTK